jgi:hypothetical protein
MILNVTIDTDDKKEPNSVPKIQQMVYYLSIILQ